VYTPRSFAMTDAEAVRFIHEHPFALLVGPGPDDPLSATHLPLLYRPADPPGTAELLGHMARANPHWRALDGQSVLAVFQGPHAYISQRWYGTWPDVPTWNYVTVHAHGTLRLVPDTDAPGIVEMLVAAMEPTSPIIGQLDAPGFREELRAIVAFRITVTRLDGKQKLGQNRPAVQRRGAAAGLRATGRCGDREIADLMEATTLERDRSS
jgi:transcriptional regulator